MLREKRQDEYDERERNYGTIEQFMEMNVESNRNMPKEKERLLKNKEFRKMITETDEDQYRQKNSTSAEEGGKMVQEKRSFVSCQRKALKPKTNLH